MARPAPIPPQLDDDFDEAEAEFTTEKRDAPQGENKLARPANDTGAPTPTAAQLKEDVDRAAPAAEVAVPDPVAVPPGVDDRVAVAESAPAFMTAERQAIGEAPRAVRGKAYDIGGVVYLAALALVAAAVSAAIVLVLF